MLGFCKDIMGESAVIITKNLSKNFGDVKALDSLNLLVDHGITFGLFGPNGSGKTTLIRALVGLIKPDSGNLSILGESPKSKHYKQRVGYMTQQPALYSELTAFENLDFFARIYGLGKTQRKKRIDELFELVGLTEKKKSPVYALSGGMTQRLSLACALVHQPELVFLDEPTVGIDPVMRNFFWDYFKSLNAKGTTIVISSHVMDEAKRCNQLGLLYKGRLIAKDTYKNLLQKNGKKDLEDVFIDLAEG
jgi:ABC-2 type transport system ATP-binding protein